MQRLHILVLLCTLLPVAIATAQTAATGDFNGSFERLDAETGLPAGWTPWVAENLSAYSLAMAHDGVACASVTDDSPTVSQGLRSPRVPIVGGETYTASGWVWITELQQASFAIYLEFWRGDERVANYAVSTAECGRWVELKIQKAAPAEATAATVLIYGSSATVGHACFDDISLAGPTPVANRPHAHIPSPTDPA